MNNETKKITQGALMLAIFGVMLVLNRQTAGLFTELLLYVLPVPMVAYSAKWGLKPSIALLISMCLITPLFGDILMIFYAVTQAIIGMVLGGCIFHKVDPGRSLFAVMSLSTLANLTNTVFFAELFGMDIQTQVAEVQTMMNESFSQAAQMTGNEEMLAVYSSVFNTSLLTRMYIISMILLGIVQGFLVYQISLLILNRLHMEIKRPKSIYLYYPPKWTGWLAAGLYFAYLLNAARLPEGQIRTILETAGMCAYLYMVIFGFMGMMLFIRARFGQKKFPAFLISVLLFMLFQTAVAAVGVIYIVGSFHEECVRILYMQEG